MNSIIPKKDDSQQLKEGNLTVQILPNRLNYALEPLVKLASSVYSLVRSVFQNAWIRFEEWTVFLPYIRSIPYRSGVALKASIESLKQSNPSGWRDEAVRLIRHSRRHSILGEIDRLRGAEVLTPLQEALFDSAQSKLFKQDGVPGVAAYLPYLSSGVDAAKAIYAQAIEYKNIYRDTHHVFLHAQSTPWITISYLVKELQRKNHPEINMHHFKPLRAPCSTRLPGITERIFQGIYHDAGIEKYRDRSLQFFTLSDTDPKVGEDLLSVDASFFSSSPCASALFFLSHNTNILYSNEVIQEVAKNTILHYYPNLSEEEANSFAKKAFVLIKYERPLCSNLFTICIPKNKDPAPYYRSHSFGWTCTCHPSENNEKILIDLGNDLLDESTLCNSLLYNNKPPQYRLFLPEIRPQEDNHIFLSTPFSKLERKFIKSEMKNIVNNIHQFSLTVARNKKRNFFHSFGKMNGKIKLNPEESSISYEDGTILIFDTYPEKWPQKTTFEATLKFPNGDIHKGSFLLERSSQANLYEVLKEKPPHCQVGTILCTLEDQTVLRGEVNSSGVFVGEKVKPDGTIEFVTA